MTDYDLDLSIVIPCYNEASREDLEYRLNKVVTYMCDDTNISYEIILVNDGSTDNTLDILYDFQQKYSNISVFSYENNVGKGYAEQLGIKEAQGRYTLLMDADLSIPLKNITKFYNYITKATLHHLVVGDRVNKHTGKSIFRYWLSTGSHFVTGKILDIKRVKDTQCGFKMFITEKVQDLLPYFECKRWLFDIELILYMQALGIKTKGIQVYSRNNLDSTLNSKEALITSIKELLTILRHKGRNIRNIRAMLKNR